MPVAFCSVRVEPDSHCTTFCTARPFSRHCCLPPPASWACWQVCYGGRRNESAQQNTWCFSNNNQHNVAGGPKMLAGRRKNRSTAPSARPTRLLSRLSDIEPASLLG